MIRKPCIILVRPQMGENIGAAARAMANLGLYDLRLVSPRDGWPNQNAIDNASGGFEHINVTVVKTLQEALADLHYSFATTARPRDMVKDVFDPIKACQRGADMSAQNQNIGFVFGPERTGLENDEIALCQSIVSFPVNAEFSSLNLGQAVLLICYEFAFCLSRESGNLPEDNKIPVFAGKTKKEDNANHKKNEAVTQDKLEEFLTRLEHELEDGGFFKSEGLKPTMVRNIRNIFSRQQLTDQEVRTLHGILSALIKKA